MRHKLVRSTIRAALAVVLVSITLTQARSEALPQAKPQQAGLCAETLAHVDTAMKAFVDKEAIAGGVVMVLRRGKVVKCDAYGKADGEKPMQTDTIVRIYSMTKPITSTAAMMLCEEGKLELDDPVCKYLPEFADLKVLANPGAKETDVVEAKRAMSVRDLLRHTSGLTYGAWGNSAVHQAYRRDKVLDWKTDDLADMVEKLGKIPLLHQPGTVWHYGVSTDVLGRLVEVVSGQSLDVFFSERIFKPLEMNDTAFYVPDDKRDRFAATFGPDADGGIKVVDSPLVGRYNKGLKLLSGGGGLVSTASDYMRFCRMLLDKGQLDDGRRLLKTETVELMTQNHLPQGVLQRPGVGFGLGFAVRFEPTDDEAGSPAGEYGWGGAASTHFWISPSDELVVVALTQYMPYSDRVERAIKPIIYKALVD